MQNGSSDQFLAGAAFASYKYIYVSRGDAPDQLVHLSHRRRLADDSLDGKVIVRLFIDRRYVDVAANAKRLADVLRQDLRLDRGNQVVKSASLDGL